MAVSTCNIIGLGKYKSLQVIKFGLNCIHTTTEFNHKVSLLVMLHESQSWSFGNMLKEGLGHESLPEFLEVWKGWSWLCAVDNLTAPTKNTPSTFDGTSHLIHKCCYVVHGTVDKEHTVFQFHTKHLLK